MGRRQGTTVPFEREELERLAEATSSKADYRPTSKLSRDELLGLVSRSALAEKSVAAPVAALPATEQVAASPAPEPVPASPAPEPAAASPAPEPAAASPAPEPAAASPAPEPVPASSAPGPARRTPEPHVPLAASGNREHAGEHRPRAALRALTAPDSLRDNRASHAGAIVRPIAPRRGVPMVVSLALVVAAVIAVLLFVL